MGRPIQKKWFGPANTGVKIIVNGAKWADGTTASNVYIVKQVGDTAYLVSDGSTKTEILFMVNASSTGALAAGQCYILATPFGGSAVPCRKIQQFRLSTFNADGTTGNFSWSTQPASAAGQADLITLAELGAPVNTVAPAVTPASGTVTASTVFTVNNPPGTWTGNPTITYAYQWYVGATPIAGATANTYTATAPGIGSVTVRVTATNGVGSTTATSNAVTITA